MPDGFGPHRFGHHELSGMGPLHFIIPLAAYALLLGLGIWLIMSIRHNTAARAGVAQPGVVAASPPPDTALREVRMRYARGELTREEFMQISRDLGADLPPEPPVT